MKTGLFFGPSEAAVRLPLPVFQAYKRRSVASGRGIDRADIRTRRPCEKDTPNTMARVAFRQSTEHQDNEEGANNPRLIKNSRRDSETSVYWQAASPSPEGT
jgi:hypothetical protein